MSWKLWRSQNQRCRTAECVQKIDSSQMSGKSCRTDHFLYFAPTPNIYASSKVMQVQHHDYNFPANRLDSSKPSARVPTRASMAKPSFSSSLHASQRFANGTIKT